jgi:hypothetical protein
MFISFYFFTVPSIHPSIQLDYTFKNKLKLNLNYHLFFAPAKEAYSSNLQRSNAFLGQEIDFVLRYPIKKYLILHLGYGHLIGTTNLETLKPSGRVYLINNWAWLMLDVKLELFKHVINSTSWDF